MSKPNLWCNPVSKFVWILFFSLTVGLLARGNSYPDTTGKRLLAAAGKNETAGYITLAANVEFPSVLEGNESHTLSYVEKFAESRRAYLIRTYNRSKKYFPKVSAILKKHNLPQELCVLLALESAFNAHAVSKAGAVGYWQIMDEVAKEYGLKYVPAQTAADKKKTLKTAAKKDKKATPVKDDRTNFYKSTYAAARYLKDRSRNLNNNLLLMVASYNCGVGNVWDAMKKSGKADPDFWDIKAWLPAETQAYVMNFITLNVIFHNYDKFASNNLLFTPEKVNLADLEGYDPGASSTPESQN